MTRPAASPQVPPTEHDDAHRDHDHDHDDDGYRGPATLTVDGVDHEVQVRLTGHFQPLDGWYHWYGRVDADAAIETALGGRKRAVRVVTPHGGADGEIADPDPWGRYRLSGTSTPPFSHAARSAAELPRGTRETGEA